MDFPHLFQDRGKDRACPSTQKAFPALPVAAAGDLPSLQTWLFFCPCLIVATNTASKHFAYYVLQILHRKATSIPGILNLLLILQL